MAIITRDSLKKHQGIGVGGCSTIRSIIVILAIVVFISMGVANILITTSSSYMLVVPTHPLKDTTDAQDTMERLRRSKLLGIRSNNRSVTRNRRFHDVQHSRRNRIIIDPFKPKLFFHHFRRGPSSDVIYDMLLCHAYAFHHNATYGGSCRGEGSATPRDLLPLLKAVGLQDQLRLACPRDYSYYSNTNETIYTSQVIPRQEFRKNDTRLFTPDYLDYLKSVLHDPSQKRGSHQTFTIAVHIQRGKDITPCRGAYQGYDPYLPNSHFLTLIESYYLHKPHARVVIFSQNQSYEPWDDFRTKGYQVVLEQDADKEDDHRVRDTILLWKTMAMSDVVILSRSSDTIIPAILAKGTVVYTPFWHPPLHHWKNVVDDASLLEMSQNETQRLRDTCFTATKLDDP